MSVLEAILLLGGGALAGAINAMAGGGSMLTVPLLVLAGVEGNAANGSNRVGILTSNVASMLSFRGEGVRANRNLVPIILPGMIGAPLGAFVIDRFTDDAFERFFGLLMIPLIALTIFRPKPRTDVPPWPVWLTALVFFGIGIYAGAIQAGVGLVLLTAFSRAGLDLVTANMVKVIFIFFVTCEALAIFILQGNVRWAPAIVLAVGLSVGGWVGAKFAVRGGEKWIRVVMVISAVALAARLIFG
ncbi:MAG: sulfite exporter TauE/SafE family protein [Actinomycetota bacterium]